MQNVVLTVHLLLALALIGVVLLQRNEGGGGLMGGGGSTAAGRGSTTPLGKATWILGIAFVATSITLTILAAQDSAGGSVLDRIGGPAPAVDEEGIGANADDLLPPSLDDALPPPAADPDAVVVPVPDVAPAPPPAD
ncbi:MAG: preprotein translocase subunit SecG [Hasllibacter sp.]